MQKLEVKWIDINLIKPYEKNAKTHSQTQIENVAESIKQFGFKQTLVLDKDFVIIIGHCRFMASKALGLEKVPCIIADDLDAEQVKKLRIIDNKTNESDWDLELLSEDIADLDFSDFVLDFGLISPDEFGEDFELPSDDKSNMEQITFTLTTEQMEIVKGAIESVVVDESDDMYGNTNKNGNAIYEVCKQWAEQKK